jgi:hypothetical protein
MHACRASDKMSAVTARFLFVCGALLLSTSGVFADGEYQRTKNRKTMVWNNDPKPGDEAAWSGDRDREGYATGFGTLTWYTAQPKGESGSAKSVVYVRYWGNMVRGKFNGAVNAHSKGKTDYAIFADGKRTTRWATGPAPSWRVAHSRAMPPAKPATAAEARAEGPPAVREKENALATARASLGEQPQKVSRAGSPIRPRYDTPELVREQGAQQSPNSESLREQPAQGPSEHASANELSLQRAPPAKPAAAAEAPADEPPTVKETENAQPASARPLPVAEPEAPAEGPRVVQVEGALATASSSPGEQSATPSSESFPEQPAQPRTEDTPSVSIQPSKESVPTPPSSTKSQAEVEDSLQSVVQPPSSLLAIPETAGSPRAGPRLMKEEVIRIANAAARRHGYNRADYERAEPQYNPVHNIWSVSYDQSAADGAEEPGKHFNVIVDDKTKGTVFVLRR